MTRFDEERYIGEVLEPARQAGGRPPADLMQRYGLSAPLSPGQVTETLPAVLGCWRRVRRELRYRTLVSRLEADHTRLAGVFDKAKAGDLGPLRAAIADARSADGAKQARLRAEIDDIAGPVGRITPQLAAELAGGQGVSAAEAGAVLDSAGVRVVGADPLPRRPPLAGYPRYREALRTLGCRHTADFVLDVSRPAAGDGDGLTVWEIVGVAGRTDDRVGEDTVQAADHTWAARPHDGSRTLASTVLVALKALLAQRGAAGVAELVRYEVAEELRTRRRQGASAAALVEYARAGLGLAADDARRLVFAVQAEAPTSDPAPPPARSVPQPPPDTTPHPAGKTFSASAGQISATPPARRDEPAAAVTQPARAAVPPLAAHAPLPAPRHVVADRAGDEVVVRWEWPPELTAVGVRWRLGDQPWRATSVSRGAYRSQGGAWLPLTATPDGAVTADGDPDVPLRIVLVPLAARHGRRVEGPPLTVQVPGRMVVWYQVTRTGPPWRRELTVAVRTRRHARLRRLMVVLRRGTVMPLHARDGEVLRQLDDVRLAPDRPLTVRLPAPRGPYWLRCFAADDEVELRDPPVAQLRGQ